MWPTPGDTPEAKSRSKRWAVSRRLARSAVAIAVRVGAPRPAIDTETALREAVWRHLHSVHASRRRLVAAGLHPVIACRRGQAAPWHATGLRPGVVSTTEGIAHDHRHSRPLH